MYLFTRSRASIHYLFRSRTPTIGERPSLLLHGVGELSALNRFPGGSRHFPAWEIHVCTQPLFRACANTVTVWPQGWGDHLYDGWRLGRYGRRTMADDAGTSTVRTFSMRLIRYGIAGCGNPAALTANFLCFVPSTVVLSCSRPSTAKGSHCGYLARFIDLPSSAAADAFCEYDYNQRNQTRR